MHLRQSASISGRNGAAPYNAELHMDVNSIRKRRNFRRGLIFVGKLPHEN